MNEKPIFKTKKIFDCKDMPTKVLMAFKEYYTGNDKYIEWTIWKNQNKDALIDLFKTGREVIAYKFIVDDWLVQHGAEPCKNENSAGETVLIKHWW